MECPKPLLEGETTQSLVDLVAEAIKALDKCNSDKSALRAWASNAEGYNEH